MTEGQDTETYLIRHHQTSCSSSDPSRSLFLLNIQQTITVQPEILRDVTLRALSNESNQVAFVYNHILEKKSTSAMKYRTGGKMLRK